MPKTGVGRRCQCHEVRAEADPGCDDFPSIDLAALSEPAQHRRAGLDPRLW